MKHRRYREGDEFVCSCGYRWGVGEADPHRPKRNRIVFEDGRYVLKTVKSDRQDAP